MKTKQQLKKHNWNADIVDGDDGCYFESSGISGVICTGYAVEVRRILGADRVKIFGFFAEDNPEAQVSQIADGHDFAVVDGRFIVDPWISDVENISDEFVFDLQKDIAKIKKIYGNSTKWQENKDA